MPAPNPALGQVALKKLVTEAGIGVFLGIIGGAAWQVTVTYPNGNAISNYYNKEGTK